MSNRWTPFLIIGLFGTIFLSVNTVFLCYPTDNDLDEIGWLVDNLTFSRLESFSNTSYPPGLPVLLYLLTPILGSLLRAALVCEALAGAATMYFAYRLSCVLHADQKGAVLTLILTALVIFPSATSEFADGISVALLTGSLYILLSGRRGAKNNFLAGVCIGIAYLFRYHYLVFLALIPVASLIFREPAKGTRRNIGYFILGFVAGSFPLLILNSVVRGTPIYTGVSGYMVGQYVMQTLDWRNYLDTYDLWPLSKLVREHPVALIKHMVSVMSNVAYIPYILTGAVVIPLSVGSCKEPEVKRALLFLGVIAVSYSVLVILPTMATDRGLLPVSVIVSLLVVWSLVRYSERLSSGFGATQFICLLIAIALVGNVPSSSDHLRKKYHAQSYNRQIIEALKKEGMTSSSELFCDNWNIHPLGDPKFITFYNYGGWILLDSKYASERPVPTAKTVTEWRSFLLEHDLRYLVIRRTDATEPFFAEELSHSEWKLVFWDGQFLILAML